MDLIIVSILVVIAVVVLVVIMARKDYVTMPATARRRTYGYGPDGQPIKPAVGWHNDERNARLEKVVTSQFPAKPGS